MALTIGGPSSSALSASYATRATSTTPGPFGGARKTAFSVNVIGRGSTGRLYAVSAGGFLQSEDNGVTISSNKTLPANVSHTPVKGLVEFGSHIYINGVDSSTGRAGTWRATPSSGNTALTWAKVHEHQAGVADTIGTNISADDTYVYTAEYGDATSGLPQAYRSADGTTWETIFSGKTTRHIHAIAPDPYNDGHLWLTAGDGSDDIIYRSTDYGTNWTRVTADPLWQSVQISFDERYVYFAGDSRVATMMVFDRTAGVLKVGTPNHHRFIPVPGAIPRAAGHTFSNFVTTSGSKVVTSATAAFVSTDKGRELLGSALPNSRSWIASVDSATQVTLFDNAASSSGAATLSLGGEQFYANAYNGAVEPITGAYYCVAMDTSALGTRPGWFRAPGVGQPLELIDALPPNEGWKFGPVIFNNGRAFSGPWSVPIF